MGSSGPLLSRAGGRGAQPSTTLSPRPFLLLSSLLLFLPCSARLRLWKSRRRNRHARCPHHAVSPQLLEADCSASCSGHWRRRHIRIRLWYRQWRGNPGACERPNRNSHRFTPRFNSDALCAIATIPRYIWSRPIPKRLSRQTPIRRYRLTHQRTHGPRPIRQPTHPSRLTHQLTHRFRPIHQRIRPSRPTHQQLRLSRLTHQQLRLSRLTRQRIRRFQQPLSRPRGRPYPQRLNRHLRSRPPAIAINKHGLQAI